MTTRAGAVPILFLLVAGAIAVSARADETLRRRASRDELRAEFERALNDFDDAQRTTAQDAERARQLFRSAAQRFESIVSSGIRNGKLEYDLGNCYLQAGDVGRAVLHYRRAERLIPGDPALHDNFGVARGRCLTPIAASRGQTFRRNVLFWHYQLSAGNRMNATIVFYVAVWSFLTVGSATSRRWPRVTAVVCALICAALGASALVSHWQDRNAPEGVVTMPDTVVLKGPGAGYQRQFEQPLQPGVAFTLQERRGTWWSIELPDGQDGWIDGGRAELVPWDAP